MKKIVLASLGAALSVGLAGCAEPVTDGDAAYDSEAAPAEAMADDAMADETMTDEAATAEAAAEGAMDDSAAMDSGEDGAEAEAELNPDGDPRGPRPAG